MRIITTMKETGKREDGASLGTVIILAVVIAVLVVIFIDSASVYYNWQSTNDVTEQAARLAAFEYNATKSEVQAENRAADYCEENGMAFTEFSVNLTPRTFNIACSKDAKTYVFKSLPVFKDLIHQEARVSTENL
ncbi:MAG: hypothetical protein WC828_06020 [Thermoleophilia bacterium]|jgi:Flp pilus assembly protein TadG